MNVLTRPIPRSAMIPPNAYQRCLYGEHARLEQIHAGGQESLFRQCCGANYAGSETPWIQMPATARRFHEQGSIVLSTMTVNTDYVVRSFQVPAGQDGVLTSHFQMYTGSGFMEGSGDIIWRIRIGRAYIKDYSAMQTSLGNNTSPIPFNRGGIRLYSRDRVEYIARLGTDAPTHLDFTARIIVATLGYFYSQQ